MFVALLCGWTIVFLVLIKGVKSLGKFSYVTTTLPYLVLLTLLIKSTSSRPPLALRQHPPEPFLEGPNATWCL